MKIIRTALAVAALGGLAGALPAWGQTNPPPQSTLTLQLADFTPVGRNVAQELAAKEFEKVPADFNDDLKKRITPAILEQSWNKLLDIAGQFQKVGEALQVERQGMQFVRVELVFERASMYLRMGMDADGKIAGMRFEPTDATTPWAAPDYAQVIKFHEESVTVGAAPWDLPGTLTLPTGAGPFPAVVLVPGSGPEDQDESIGPNKMFKDIAWGLATQGVAVLRFVKRTRAHGKEIGAGNLPITVKEEEIDDARAAVTLLAARQDIDAKHIYIAGHSLGGYLAPRIAKGDAQIAGLIILAGNTRPIEDLIVDQVKYEAALNGPVTPDGQKAIDQATKDAQAVEDPNLKPGTIVHLLGDSLSSDYLLDLRDYHPADVAATLGIPMYVLQGERDYQVTMTDFNGWKKTLANKPGVSFKTYPALSHYFMPGTGPGSPADYLKANHVEPDVVTDIASWVKSQSPAAAGAAASQE